MPLPPAPALISAPHPAPATDAADDTRTPRWFRAVFGACFIATLLLSIPLWLTARDYPHVPVVDWLPQPPPPLDWVLLGAMLAALAAVCLARRPVWALRVVLAIGAVWVVMDQTRWQPYMLTYMMGAACLLAGESATVRRAGAWHLAPFQLAVCGTYVYSGLHKFNARYVEWDFPRLLRPVLAKLDVGPPPWMLGPALFTAAFEMALGLALLWPRTRRLAVVGLTAMHAFLMLVLGPLGTGSNSVIWPWNVLMVAALWMLFWPERPAARFDRFVRATWPPRRAGPGDGGAPVPPPLRAAWVAAVAFFVVLPVLSFVEAWPAALSFQLYSGKQRDVRILYHPARRASLPPAARGAERAPGDISLPLWSMREMNVVPVMDTRVAVRIGRDLARRAPGADVRVHIAGMPGLIDGRRDYRVIAFRGEDQTPADVTAAMPEPWPARK